MADFSLNSENVKHLLPPGIFYDLFSKSIPSSIKRALKSARQWHTYVINSLGDGVAIQATNSPSTHVGPVWNTFFKNSFQFLKIKKQKNLFEKVFS